MSPKQKDHEQGGGVPPTCRRVDMTGPIYSTSESSQEDDEMMVVTEEGRRGRTSSQASSVKEMMLEMSSDTDETVPDPHPAEDEIESRESAGVFGSDHRCMILSHVLFVLVVVGVVVGILLRRQRQNDPFELDAFELPR